VWNLIVFRLVVFRNVAIIALGFVISTIGVEYAYRYYLVQKFAHGYFAFSIVDAPYRLEDIKTRESGDGLYLKNARVSYRMFDKNHQLQFESKIHTNQAGYRSGYEYPSLIKDEVRIAVIGDSMTANLQSDFPWTDILHQRLNSDEKLKKRLNIKRFVVYNFAIAGAGFETMAQIQWDHARKFRPHLTIVNFITPDIIRNYLHIQPVANLNLAPRRYRGLIDISTPETPAKTVVICDKPELSLGSPDCKPSTLIFVDARHVFDKSAISKVRLALSSQFIWSKLWRSTYPYSVSAAMGRPFVLNDKSFFDIFELVKSAGPTKSGYANQSLEKSAHAVKTMLKAQKNLIILHNPIIGEILAKTPRPGPAQTLEKKIGQPICYMADFMQNAHNPEEIKSWFIPRDGHFNNRGAGVYGEAVYRLIRKTMDSGFEVAKPGKTNIAHIKTICGPPPQ
jgi:hypothetical protein